MPTKLTSVTIENFKAIQRAKIPISSGLTVLVGQNSAGKSSVLQAIHWSCRCVANPKIQRNQTRSLSVYDFDFYPTPNIRSVGNNRELRQKRGDAQEVSVKVSYFHSTESSSNPVTSIVRIGQGNNEAVKVDLSEDAVHEDFYRLLIDQARPFSAYIPGLAGVPLTEEKRSRQPITRQAASGDANTVLRNILLLIKDDPRADVSLEKLSEHCSSVLGPTSIEVDFEDVRDANIRARIRTQSMPAEHWTPLEMAGTGVLQCIQIFAYIILYRPHLLLIDEPDAHLHPDRQEKLVGALAAAAEKYSMSIVMSTHSPNVVRAMPATAQIVWMANGEVKEASPEAVRQRMGWGILDKKVLLITEDGQPTELKSILSQWPEIDRITSVWPVSGHRSLPNPEACRNLLEMTGMERLLLHRDGDFMTPGEREILRKKYESPEVQIWITDDSDIEAYFLNKARIERLFELDSAEVQRIYAEILDEGRIEFEDAFSAKRQEICEDRRIHPKRDEAPQTATARSQIPQGENGLGHIHGKRFAKILKAKLNSLGKDSSKLLSANAGENDICLALRTTIFNFLQGT